MCNQCKTVSHQDRLLDQFFANVCALFATHIVLQMQDYVPNLRLIMLDPRILQKYHIDDRIRDPYVYDRQNDNPYVYTRHGQYRMYHDLVILRVILIEGLRLEQGGCLNAIQL
jgi:hypothetical protein